MIICDIDDTLLRNGTQPIKHVIDWLNAQKGEKVIVTGRPDTQREATRKALKAAGVHYSRLMMNPYGTHDSNKWKAEAAKELHTATLAIDNDAGARAAYAKEGIPTKDPATIDKSWNVWSIFNKYVNR
jgi:ribonucleotide monophosphatase NagD (HAD superfamily)